MKRLLISLQAYASCQCAVEMPLFSKNDGPLLTAFCCNKHLFLIPIINENEIEFSK
jgi:hypothetical protein